MENGKWGLYLCSSPFSSYIPLFLPEGRVCRSYLREKRKKKNAAEECEIVQNSREQRGSESHKAIFFFFFEGLSGRVESKKRRDTRREEECGGVKSVYLPKESDSRLPANNPLWLLHFSATP